MYVVLWLHEYDQNQQLKSVAHLPWKAFMYKVHPHSSTQVPLHFKSIINLYFLSGV